jgi:hypothetical protein
MSNSLMDDCRGNLNLSLLRREAVVAQSATTAVDGKSCQIEYFNLDVISRHYQREEIGIELEPLMRGSLNVSATSIWRSRGQEGIPHLYQGVV